VKKQPTLGERALYQDKNKELRDVGWEKMRLSERVGTHRNKGRSSAPQDLPIEEVENSILRGDAFDIVDRLPEESVDLVITSPPYWGQRSYELRHNWELFNDIPKVRSLAQVTQGYDWYRRLGGVLGLEPYPEWYVVHLAEILNKLMRVLKPTGSFWLNLGDTYFARWSSIRDTGRQGLTDKHRKRRKTPMGGIRQEKQLLLLPSRVAVSLQERGWILRNDLIWHKPNATPRPEGDRLKLSHEHFFHFVRRAKVGRAKYYYKASHAEKRQNDVIVVNSEPGEADHTATFPPAVIAPRIVSSCPVDGLVLDPFCGTGRALEVAISLGRKAVGIELQEKFSRAAQLKLFLSPNGKEKTVLQRPEIEEHAR